MKTSRSRSARPAAVALCGVLAFALVACSGSGGGKAKRSTDQRFRPTGREVPGPAADVSQEITGGNGPFVGSASGAQLEGTGYIEHEYVASGTATSYRATAPMSEDGRWTFAPESSAPYRTRILVRRPAQASRFSGNVAVEWLNVSGGIDADPDYATLREELVRSGDIWVGVSTQVIGVMGGPVLVGAPGANGIAGKGLKTIDAARYGTLDHPGDAFAYDIYTQVARAVHAGGPAFGGVKPKHIIAVGESQSAFALVTYVNGVQPLTKVFDGFFVHSRGSVGLPLAKPGQYADIANSLSGTATIFRTDTDAPIMDVQTESDVTGVLSSLTARQPDTERFRLWEVAGTAHADKHLVGPIADQLQCGVPINNGPTHVVAKAAFHALKRWIATGEQPPHAPRLVVTTGDKPAVARDRDGIARGGIRTPPVDVPVDVLSGEPGPTGGTICLLLGSTKPLPQARLAELYRSRTEYERRYREDADATVGNGFALRADRDALLAFADPSRIPG